MIRNISPRALSSANTIIMSIVFTWIGFVCAISFMEAWLKFQAPGMTLTIGLSVGKLVFGALNQVELLSVWPFGYS